MRLSVRHIWLLAATFPLVLALAAAGPAVPQSASHLGFPLPGLNRQDQLLFWAASQVFRHDVSPAKGLGPIFNGRSCVECHGGAAPGGPGNSADSRVTLVGAIVNGEYSHLEAVGGPFIQRRSLAELLPGQPDLAERVPTEAQFVSHRVTPHLFGMGLIEAISEQTILELADTPRPDGIQGEPNWVLNPETSQMEVGRFGWKAQISTLHWFSGDAYVNEMGVTSPSFQFEPLPAGQPLLPGADGVLDPEDIGSDVDAFTRFMRFLAPAPSLPLSIKGARLFEALGCANCHVPSLTTGNEGHPVLRNKEVRLYSDLLLHRMGPGLADGIRQGSADGEQFRTAPLWGLRLRKVFLHDGRASDLDEAILLHGGEAGPSAERYRRLRHLDKRELKQFLLAL